MSDAKFFSNTKSQEQISSEEVSKTEHKEVIDDQAYWTRHDVIRSRRRSPSKAELMEQLSRERFPEEE